LGIISNFFKLYYDDSSEPSRDKFFDIILKGIGSIIINGKYAEKILELTKGVISIDKKCWYTGDYRTIAASSLSGANIVLFKPFENIPKDKFRVVGADFRVSGLDILKKLPAIIMGKDISNEGILYEDATELGIFNEKQSLYTLDGEMYNGKNLKIELGPKLNFIKV